MEDVLELKVTQSTTVLINPYLNKYEKKVPSKKLKEANETLERYPPPAEWSMKLYSKMEQEHGFPISGVVKRANASMETFMVLIMDDDYEIHYHIRTTPETLNKIVKTYWNETINVQIRPQINKDNQFEYELIAIDIA